MFAGGSALINSYSYYLCVLFSQCGGQIQHGISWLWKLFKCKGKCRLPCCFIHVNDGLSDFTILATQTFVVKKKKKKVYVLCKIWHLICWLCSAINSLVSFVQKLDVFILLIDVLCAFCTCRKLPYSKPTFITCLLNKQLGRHAKIDKVSCIFQFSFLLIITLWKRKTLGLAFCPG